MPDRWHEKFPFRENTDIRHHPKRCCSPGCLTPGLCAPVLRHTSRFLFLNSLQCLTGVATCSWMFVGFLLVSHGMISRYFFLQIRTITLQYLYFFTHSLYMIGLCIIMHWTDYRLTVHSITCCGKTVELLRKSDFVGFKLSKYRETSFCSCFLTCYLLRGRSYRRAGNKTAWPLQKRCPMGGIVICK